MLADDCSQAQLCAAGGWYQRGSYDSPLDPDSSAGTLQLCSAFKVHHLYAPPVMKDGTMAWHMHCAQSTPPVHINKQYISYKSFIISSMMSYKGGILRETAEDLEVSPVQDPGSRSCLKKPC